MPLGQAQRIYFPTGLCACAGRLRKAMNRGSPYAPQTPRRGALPDGAIVHKAGKSPSGGCRGGVRKFLKLSYE